ncbi:HIV Tat-specific factor 1 homolog [Zeugodacus cucurbitae]|uniref:HIV Tat-specific factor 1 homolog n=1 Tax=Zeugodacus cucurbitae TaxID=28588 RepID=UPI0023D8EBC0|nr:HIV Tat-specific factor 1 homolog [Zeugodacus cucurbitae]
MSESTEGIPEKTSSENAELIEAAENSTSTTAATPTSTLPHEKAVSTTSSEQNEESSTTAEQEPNTSEIINLEKSESENVVDPTGPSEVDEIQLKESAVESAKVSSEKSEEETGADKDEKESNNTHASPKSTEAATKAQSSTATPSTEAQLDDNYAQHVTYEADGSAIYTDPNTNSRYKWCTTENNWLPCDAEHTDSATTTTSTENPYENEHYKWCSQSQKWIPKVQQQTTETEHYKWDAVKKEWIPKVSASSSDPVNVTYDIDAEGQRIYTDKDGTVFFWDESKNAWFPKIDDDFMAHYQMNYGFIDNTSASEEEARLKAEEEKKQKELELQRMTEEAKAAAAATANANGDGAPAIKRKAQEPPKWFDLDPEQNTKVYVSNLPLDITMDEFAELMGKCGMIMRDPQTQKYKLKLYAEADGQLKGDGLCDYIKVESVGLALNILDEYNLRGQKIRVQRAKFQMRGEYNPALKPKRKKKDKEKLQKMKEKLFDWRPEKMRGERSKNEKVVIIKNLFDPVIFEKEVQLILDYQNELREECSKCGTVRKVVIYDRHPEGVAQVNMADPEEADVVIQMMHGRFFGQRKLSAEHWDGKTKYKIVETEAEVQKRLSHWDQYLTREENEEKDALHKSLTEATTVADAAPAIAVEEEEKQELESSATDTPKVC